MRACKSECSLFKELYRFYVEDKVEGETKQWMDRHKNECTYCRNWCKSIDENREDKVEQEYEPKKDVYDESKKTIKKARLFMLIGMGIIIFAAVLMSAGLGT